MLDLKKVILPSAIEVEGNFFTIKTDYQYFLILSEKLQSPALLTDFDYMYLNKIPKNRQEGINQLIKFAYPEREIPRRMESSSARLLDYTIDADYIYAAFMEKYNLDILNPDLHLHWYKFQALLNGLGECKLTEIIGYRSFEPEKKSDFKKDMLKNKRAWELPTILSQEEKEALDLFDRKFS